MSGLHVAPCAVDNHQQPASTSTTSTSTTSTTSIIIIISIIFNHPAQYRRRGTRFRAASEGMTRVLITRQDPSTAEPRHGTGFGDMSSSEHRPALSTFGAQRGPTWPSARSRTKPGGQKGHEGGLSGKATSPRSIAEPFAARRWGGKDLSPKHPPGPAELDPGHAMCSVPCTRTSTCTSSVGRSRKSAAWCVEERCRTSTVPYAGIQRSMQPCERISFLLRERSSSSLIYPIRVHVARDGRLLSLLVHRHVSRLGAFHPRLLNRWRRGRRQGGRGRSSASPVPYEYP